MNDTNTPNDAQIVETLRYYWPGIVDAAELAVHRHATMPASYAEEAIRASFVSESVDFTTDYLVDHEDAPTARELRDLVFGGEPGEPHARLENALVELAAAE